MSIIRTDATVVFDPKDHTNKHKKQSSWKKSAMAMIPEDLCDFYAWFIRRRYSLKLNTPLRDSHMTIVNDRASDTNGSWDKVKKEWQNKKIPIYYSTDVRTNGEHWWMVADSFEAREIRTQLGLNPEPYFKYHITIGYANEKNLAHSEYIHRQIGMFPDAHRGKFVKSMPELQGIDARVALAQHLSNIM